MGRTNGARFEPTRFGLRILLGAALLGGYLGCGASDMATSPKVADLPAVRSEALEHESCGSGLRSDSLDTNGDAKPDITRYYDGSGHEVCRVVDLNRDGKPDLYEYYDASGQIRRREYCYDDSGAVNAIEFYESGRLARREYDIGGHHRIDTWDWFDPGEKVDDKTGRPPHPARRERDTRGDGHVDQWWTWNGDQLTIAFDRDGDGKPDPGAVLVFGGDGGAPESPAYDAPPSGPHTAAADTDGGAQDNRGSAAERGTDGHAPASDPAGGGGNR